MSGQSTRVVQVSDSHLSARHGYFVGNWAAVIDQLSADPPDLVINSGDLSINGADDDGDLRFATAQHRRLPSPWRAIPGNHDIGEEPDALLLGQPIDGRRVARWRRIVGPDYWSVEVGRWRLVGINGFLYGSGLADDDEQHRWLTALVESSDRPIGLFVHKPLFLVSPDETPEPHHSFTPSNRSRLYELLKGSTVRFVASGHLHQSQRATENGIDLLWAPSCAFPAGQALPGASTGLGWIEYEFDADDWQATVVEPPMLFAHDIDAYKDNGRYHYLYQTPPRSPDPADVRGEPSAINAPAVTTETRHEPNWIDCDGAHNVRDLGGFPTEFGLTRRRVLLRADALDALSASDVAHLVDEVGLAHVVDLRSAGERAERGRGLLGDTSIEYSDLDVIDDLTLAFRRDARTAAVEAGTDPEIIIGDGYVQLLDVGATSFVTALERIVASGGTPVLVHCAAGKDRTGVLVALLLDAAGVDRDVIVADYAATQERMDAILARLLPAAAYQHLAEDIPAFMLDARPGNMRRFLGALDQTWGGAAGFFEANGVSRNTLDEWRSLFVES
jgi:protein tyrosine/serine phosphatase